MQIFSVGEKLGRAGAKRALKRTSAGIVARKVVQRTGTAKRYCWRDGRNRSGLFAKMTLMNSMKMPKTVTTVTLLPFKGDIIAFIVLNGSVIGGVMLSTARFFAGSMRHAHLFQNFESFSFTLTLSGGGPLSSNKISMSLCKWVRGIVTSNLTNITFNQSPALIALLGSASIRESAKKQRFGANVTRSVTRPIRLRANRGRLIGRRNRDRVDGATTTTSPWRKESRPWGSDKLFLQRDLNVVGMKGGDLTKLVG
jgi:hypothetical protein